MLHENFLLIKPSQPGTQTPTVDETDREVHCTYILLFYKTIYLHEGCLGIKTIEHVNTQSSSHRIT